LPVQTIWETDTFVRRIVTADVTLDELLRSAIMLGTDSRFEKLEWIINDWSSVTRAFTDIYRGKSLNKYNNVASVVIDANPFVRNAMIVHKDIPSIDVVDHLNSYCKEGVWESKMFTCEIAAREWLKQRVIKSS
jgi:hypothetical protein